MLLLRIITALISIPIVIALVYVGGPWYALFLLLVAAVGIYEYNRILNNQFYSVSALVGFLGVILLFVVLYLEQYALVFHLVLFLLFVLFVSALFDGEKNRIQDSALALWGILYVGGLLGFLILLRKMPDGMLYTYVLLVGVWVHDIFAYFIGVKWGEHKFAPQISPNKSVEGSLAGTLAVILLFISVSILSPELIKLTPGQAVFLAFGVAVFAQLGDLFESTLKRQCKVKDSGKIIPGHGGVLDRFDSLMLAAPFAYYFFLLINMN